MKKLTQNTISLSLIIILMMSSLHVSIYKMECLITGNSQISLSNFDDCESNNQKECTISESCCCFHQMDLNLHYDTKIGADSFKLLIPLFFIVDFSSSLLEESFVKIDYFSFNNLPPPASGVELLKAIQLFLI